MDVNVIIPIQATDFHTFLVSYPYIKRNLPCRKIILIGTNDVRDLTRDLSDVEFIDEDQIINGLTIKRVKKIKKDLSGTSRRAGWYFQQFLKLAYAYICQDEYYLVWDGDTIPINNIPLFNSNGKPYLSYRDFVKKDDCYNECTARLLQHQTCEKEIHRSYITEHMLMKVCFVKEMLAMIEENKELCGGSFWEKILFSIPKRYINLSGFSEFETYTTFVHKFHNEDYVERVWNNLRNGKTYIGSNPQKEDINWIKSKFDVLSIEDFNSYWLICRILSFVDKRRVIPFSVVYSILNPIYELIFDLRYKLRDIVKR